jgi:hypothetical protein
MDSKLENVGTCIVARDVQLPSRTDQLMGLDIGVEDSLLRV